MIYDLLTEVRGDVKEMKDDLGNVKINVAQNTSDLKHHIRRTDLLQDLHESNKKLIKANEKKIEELEEPHKAKKWLKSQWLTYGSLAAAAASILGLITKVMGLW